VPGSPAPALRYHLRLATVADSEELFRIHRESMTPYLREALGEWSDEADREQHDEWFRQGRAHVITVDERVAGCLDVVRKDGVLWLLRIELDPQLQGRGIGSAVVTDLQAQAAAEGLRMILDVFSGNPARRLYERLGFRETGQDGPSIRMEWQPVR